MYRQDIVTECACQKWFARFRSDNFAFDNAPCTGWLNANNSNQVKKFVEVNNLLTSREITDIFYISKSSFSNHVRTLGFVLWILQSTEINLGQKISIGYFA